MQWIQWKYASYTFLSMLPNFKVFSSVLYCNCIGLFVLFSPPLYFRGILAAVDLFSNHVLLGVSNCAFSSSGKFLSFFNWWIRRLTNFLLVYLVMEFSCLSCLFDRMPRSFHVYITFKELRFQKNVILILCMWRKLIWLRDGWLVICGFVAKNRTFLSFIQRFFFFFSHAGFLLDWICFLLLRNISELMGTAG